ncbi:TonB-dependent receptor domain-containing protein [Flocculibacter collagenilyticus]|uniref:TonB-dependent receptor domain-containing protein n=1 Tax=Flocculibacter collagenilyticus TaxID=2744479 RepID=UPI0018F3A543|nr:TonB-dependent receptor [Flocculibacter collagenilyticus]
MKTDAKFRLSTLSFAILCGIQTPQALAQTAGQDTQTANVQQADADQIIEEVVATGTRLKGSATAVLEERKQQAFVADIMGAEQISRAGDGDAASALRRITGLTLVDGKFIYVRGLGERYSSTQLNGAAVPSPDPTRSVIPLDLFPSEIIESLSVQKSYSPSMPASFGGGNVDIRVKTIPTDFFFNMSGQLGGNSENFDDGITYQGGDNDWYGRDDGTRAAPQAIQRLWDQRTFLNDISIEENRVLAQQINRDYDPEYDTVNPDVGFDVAVGDSYETGDFRYGFLATLAYDNEWEVAEEYQGEDFRKDVMDNQTTEWVMVRGYDEITSTEHAVKWSAMLSMGIDYDRNHRLDVSMMSLNDTRDLMRDKYGNSNNILLADGQRIHAFDITYEERQLLVNQIKGMHTFPEYNFIGIDWKYSNGRSSRYAPGNVETRFLLEDGSFDGQQNGLFETPQESSLYNATTAGRYTFQQLDDQVENYGFNLSLPVSFARWEIELKSGADFVEKTRNASSRRFDINTRALGSDFDLSGESFGRILSNDAIANATLNNALLRDTTIAGDDYISAQKIDAAYIEADIFFDETWRVSGGLRWEDFQQVVVPLVPQTGAADLPSDATVNDLQNFTFQEDDIYTSLAVTYVINPEMQLRMSYGDTVVRPDLREVSNSTFIDPLTEYPIAGTPGLETTKIDNYDLRWEWYMDTGENLSVGLFYKDMDQPIESVQSPAQDGPPLIRIANAESGHVYGIEFEFLKDLTLLGDSLGGIGNDMFVSGNVTLSDSEMTLDTQSIVQQTGVSAAITNTTRRLTGHSEYVVNLQMGYDAPSGNHSVTAVYNVFGERVIIPGIEGRPDAMEQPFHSLDMVYTYYPDFNSTVKLKLQNLLNEDKEIMFDNTLLRSQTKGIGFSIAYKYEF